MAGNIDVTSVAIGATEVISSARAASFASLSVSGVATVLGGISSKHATSGGIVIQGGVVGESDHRWRVDRTGAHTWGAGAGTYDVTLARTGAATLGLTGSFSVSGASTLTGLVTAAGGVQVTGGTTGAGKLYADATIGLGIRGAVGTASDFSLLRANGANVMRNLAGTADVEFFGNLLPNGTRTLGAAASPWSDIRGTAATIGTLTVGGATSLGGKLGVTVAASTGANSYVHIESPDAANGAMLVVSSTVGQILRVMKTGVVAIGTTFTTGATGGDVVLANNKSIRAVNAAGTDTLQLLVLDVSNRTTINANSAALRVFAPSTATTVGAAGGASALPATPTGYLNVVLGSTAHKIPYYAA